MTQALEAPERIHVIRRSMRCLIFGLIGVVPFLGLAAAGLVFRAQRQVSRATGERIEFSPLNLAWGCGMVVAGLLFAGGGLLAPAVLAVALLCLEAYLLAGQFRHSSRELRNPARHLVYWGVGLAYAGCALTVLIVLGALIADPYSPRYFLQLTTLVNPHR